MRPVVRPACIILALAAPAGAAELLAAEYRLGPRAERALPPALPALVPAALRATVLPLLERRGAGRRPRPNGTTMFEPTSMVPLVGAQDAVELGVGWGRAGTDRGHGDRGRSTVVVMYVGMGW